MRSQPGGAPRPVAVKLLKKDPLTGAHMQERVQKLELEANAMRAAADEGVNDYVAMLFGLARGYPPPVWVQLLDSQHLLNLVLVSESSGGGRSEVASSGGGGAAASAPRARDREMVGLVMRWEEGGTLYDLLHDSRRAWGASTASRLQFCGQLALGLASLHTCGVVHGDIKAENVLLSERIGTVKPRISDFGFAELRAAAASTRSKSTMVVTKNKRGTWPYMAPEMLLEGDEGGPAGASRSTDVYALGTLVWETLTGNPPWAGWSEERRVRVLVQGKSSGPITLLDAPPLPIDTPMSVRQVLHLCLGPRETRPHSSQLSEVLHKAAQEMATGEFDVFLSHKCE
jgi:serine/threonine protein kinase